MAALLALSVATPAQATLVAAIQYTGGTASAIDAACRSGDDTCALLSLTRRAADSGAQLIVLPEYGLTQAVAEPVPSVGTRPETALLAPFARLADDRDVFVVVNLITGGPRPYNTAVALDPEGSVVAVHHKFELFDAEGQQLSAGDDVTVFDTPFGRVGLLVCADIYGEPALHARLTGELGAELVAFTARWTVAGAPGWPAAFARDWGVTVIAANGSGGEGRGGGVFDPTGTNRTLARLGPVLLAELPDRADSRRAANP